MDLIFKWSLGSDSRSPVKVVGRIDFSIESQVQHTIYFSNILVRKPHYRFTD